MSSTDEAVGDVMGVFPGAEVAVSIASRIDAPAATRAEQAKMRGWMSRCRTCDDDGIAGERAERVPPTFPGLHAGFVVVMDRPVLEDVGRGVGRGVAGTVLRSAFKANGLDVGAVAWTSTVACRTVGDDGLHRRPNREEKKRCWGNVADAIWHANTDRVLLVGGNAKDLWRPDLTVEQLAGVVGVLWDRYVCMVIPNPAGVLEAAGGERRMLGRQINECVKTWRRVLDEDGGKMVEGAGRPMLPVTASMARECVECRGEVDWIDRDGLGWCRVHRNERWMGCRGLGPGHGDQGRLFG